MIAQMAVDVAHDLDVALSLSLSPTILTGRVKNICTHTREGALKAKFCVHETFDNIHRRHNDAALTSNEVNCNAVEAQQA